VRCHDQEKANDADRQHSNRSSLKNTPKHEHEIMGLHCCRGVSALALVIFDTGPAITWKFHINHDRESKERATAASRRSICPSETLVSDVRRETDGPFGWVSVYGFMPSAKSSFAATWIWPYKTPFSESMSQIASHFSSIQTSCLCCYPTNPILLVNSLPRALRPSTVLVTASRFS
jgi:hypothetical protein